MGNEFGIYSVKKDIQGPKSVTFNSFFQIAIFHATLGYGMDDLGVPSAAGRRDFSHFLKRLNWVRPPPPPPHSLCTGGCCFEGKAAVALSSPLISSQC